MQPRIIAAVRRQRGGAALAAPHITSITPDHGSTTVGVPIVIAGSGFSVPGLTVMFGGDYDLTGDCTVTSDIRIDGTVGDGKAEGPYDLIITTNGGTDTLPNAYTVDP